MKVLFVHGAGNTGNITWRRQLAVFPQAAAIDLPGHPDGPRFNTVEGYSDWLNDYIESQGYQDLVLVGHSMGGAITIRHALTYPHQLKAIGLIGTGARLRINPAIFDALAEDYGKAIDLALSFAIGPDLPAEERAEWRELKLTVIPPATAEGDYRACDRFDMMSRVAEISLPTLIVCGSEDKLTPVKYSQFLHDKIAGSELHVIPRAGHAVMREKPEEFNRALAAFLTQVEQGSSR